MDRLRAAFVLLGMGFAPGVGATAAETPATHGLGLLAGKAGTDAAREKVQAGLGDSRSERRAAAARVANVSGMGALVPAVRDALASEVDGAAASEMIRFLASLARPELDAAVFAAARRLGPSVHDGLADALGRRADAVTHLAALRELGLDDRSWVIYNRLATAGAAKGPGELGAALLRERDVAGWRALLGALRKASTPLDGSLAAGGVRSESVEIRTTTYLDLALDADPAHPPDASLAAALGESPEGRGGAAVDPAAAFAFELLRRAQGSAPRPLDATLEAMGPKLKSAPHMAALFDGLVRVLDKGERKAIGREAYDSEDALDKWRPVPPGGRRPSPPQAFSGIQTVDGFPPGYVDDVLRSTGCDLAGAGVLMGGTVGYGVDGRPRNVGVLQRGASKACLEASNALLVSMLAPLGVPAHAERKFLALVPDRPEYFGCVDEAARAPRVRARMVGSGEEGKDRIDEPRKTRDVRPHYPDEAKRSGAQGVVILEAEMAASGCVHRVSLLRGVETSLDLEAMRAVAGWGYSPARLGGQPVPITMTVTVNFKLSR